MSNNYKIETKCIQSGWQPTKGEPRVLPIYQCQAAVHLGGYQ